MDNIMWWKTQVNDHKQCFKSSTVKIGKQNNPTLDQLYFCPQLFESYFMPFLIILWNFGNLYNVGPTVFKSVLRSVHIIFKFFFIFFIFFILFSHLISPDIQDSFWELGVRISGVWKILQVTITLFSLRWS